MNFSKSPLLIAFFSRTTEKAASFVLMREFFFAFIVNVSSTNYKCL